MLEFSRERLDGMLGYPVEQGLAVDLLGPSNGEMSNELPFRLEKGTQSLIDLLLEILQAVDMEPNDPDVLWREHAELIDRHIGDTKRSLREKFLNTSERFIIERAKEF